MQPQSLAEEAYATPHLSLIPSLIMTLYQLSNYFSLKKKTTKKSQLFNNMAAQQTTL